MFQIGDYVYYASGGVCSVSDICYAPLSGMPQDRQYYVLRPAVGADGVMYVPVNSEIVFLRGLLSKDEAEALLEQIPSIQVFEEPNAKALREKYLGAMRQHDPVDWVRVIKTVYRRIGEKTARAQRISETERSFAESAKRYLYAELALALDLQGVDMEEYIADHIRKMA